LALSQILENITKNTSWARLSRERSELGGEKKTARWSPYR